MTSSSDRPELSEPSTAKASVDSIPEALARYDGLRDSRLGKEARTATANREAKTAGPGASRLRNLFMPFFFNRFYGRATGWLYDYDLGTLPGTR